MTTAIRDLEQTRSAETMDRYRQLVRDSVAGAEIDPEAALETMERAGKTYDDFLHDGEHLERRMALAAEVSRKSELAAEGDTLRAEIDASARQLLAEQRRHQQFIRDREPRLAQITDQCMTIQNAERRLRDSVAPDWHKRHDEIATERKRLYAAAEPLRENLAMQEAEIRRMTRKGEDRLHPTDLDVLATRRKRADAIGEQLADIEAQRAELERAADELQREALLP